MSSDGYRRELEEIDQKIREKRRQVTAINRNNDETAINCLFEDISHLEVKKKRIMGAHENGRLHCTVKVFIVCCPGEENGEKCADEKCKGSCERSTSYSGEVELREDLLRSQYNEDFLIIDRESKIGEKIDKASPKSIVTYWNGNKYSLRIDEKEYSK